MTSGASREVLSAGRPRDFEGYGANPPEIRWPGGAGLAVNFVLNVEEGSEYSIADGDGRSETALSEVRASRVPKGERDLAAESMYEYGSRVGFWRVHRLFRSRGLPLTIFASAMALERNPAIAAAIARDRLGHLCPWLALGRALPPDPRYRGRAHRARARNDLAPAGPGAAGLVLPVFGLDRHAWPCRGAWRL